MDTRPLQSLRPFNVALFIKASLEFHQCGNLFASFGRFNQGLHDWRVASGTIEADLNGDHIRVRGSGFDKVCYGAIRRIRVMKYYILLLDCIEDIV